jgi:SAM-dependent methyltransferase
MTIGTSSNLFDKYYFDHNCGTPYGQRQDWLNTYNRIADLIVRDIQPGTMLDAGCAYGYMIEVMRPRGVECWGIDVSEHAIQSVHPDARQYCRTASVLDPLPQKYDLITCFEVVEHMPPGQGEQAIANLCRYTDDILFCSSPVDFKEATHLNVQPVEYWAEQFAVQGFYRDVDLDASTIVSWAARYRRSREPFHRVARSYERKFWQLLKENQDARIALVEVRYQLSQAAQVEASLRAQLTATQAQLVSLDELHSQLSHAVQVEASLQAQLAATQAQLVSLDEVHSRLSHAAQAQLTVLPGQPASLGKSVKDSLHLLRVKITPPGSRRERWYEVLRRRKPP